MKIYFNIIPLFTILTESIYKNAGFLADWD